MTIVNTNVIIDNLKLTHEHPTTQTYHALWPIQSPAHSKLLYQPQVELLQYQTQNQQGFLYQSQVEPIHLSYQVANHSAPLYDHLNYNQKVKAEQWETDPMGSIVPANQPLEISKLIIQSENVEMANDGKARKLYINEQWKTSVDLDPILPSYYFTKQGP